MEDHKQLILSKIEIENNIRSLEYVLESAKNDLMKVNIKLDNFWKDDTHTPQVLVENVY